MCNFLSGATLENGDVIISKNTDSHHEILKEFGVRDTELPPAFCAWEFTPPIKNERYDYAAPTDQWMFNIDKNFPTPEWWDAGIEKLTIDECKNKVNEFVVKSDVLEITCGRWIVIAGNICSVRGNATIQDVWDNATILNVRDNATIQDVWDNATILNVRDNATILNVRDNAIAIENKTNIRIIVTAKNRLEDK
jgi:hypothetical protein